MTEILRATREWRNLLNDLLRKGREVAPASLGGDWRGRTTKEIVGCRSTVPMSSPTLLCPGRKLGYKFLAAEAAWNLSGDNRLATIEKYAPKLKALSDDGRTMSGAYGPPFVDQVSYIHRCFKQDPATRQAVISLWRPRPAPGGDVPCTLTLQFLNRFDTIDTVVGMRSSDVWMGLPYDWFTFSMMTAYVALAVRPIVGPLKLGDLTVFAGSQHLYKIDEEDAIKCAAFDDDYIIDRPISELNLEEFESPDDLTEHLWHIARGEPINRSFLAGFIP